MAKNKRPKAAPAPIPAAVPRPVGANTAPVTGLNSTGAAPTASTTPPATPGVPPVPPATARISKDTLRKIAAIIGAIGAVTVVGVVAKNVMTSGTPPSPPIPTVPYTPPPPPTCLPTQIEQLGIQLQVTPDTSTPDLIITGPADVVADSCAGKTKIEKIVAINPYKDIEKVGVKVIEKVGARVALCLDGGKAYRVYDGNEDSIEVSRKETLNVNAIRDPSLDGFCK